ncbi:hypothetical protein [Arthrobacter glacialis]|uniref:Uncharacterized protein n=1 Tax=Arthrobacter glacialis TaxID=1664 RepID=A0A2S3ZVV7_ARTGL|nr:hypothetical protein [Arthrobacter glacialis]POH58521.1 hypothetical protein CVS28_10195 [Arthrobacter glacialis]POH73323.1 hypothetical protein CVS27_10390 [Arthrobacter glacialis]
MRINKAIRLAVPAAAATVLLVLGASGPALADHTHVKVVGNGECITVAAGSGESEVDLPTAVFQGNPNVDIIEADGLTHPLHVLVHRGVPGDHLSLYVLGSPAALAACPGELLNH